MVHQVLAIGAPEDSLDSLATDEWWVADDRVETVGVDEDLGEFDRPMKRSLVGEHSPCGVFLLLQTHHPAWGKLVGIVLERCRDQEVSRRSNSPGPFKRCIQVAFLIVRTVLHFR